MNRKASILALLLLLAASIASGKEFFDSYKEGIDAVRQKNWQVVVQKMTEAIGKNPREGKATRTYGNIFIAYHPYYYRGIAYFSLSEFEKAISDLQRATGAGEVDLGSVSSFITRAETRLAVEAQAAPVRPLPVQQEPVREPPQQAPLVQPPVQEPPQRPQPQRPLIDPAITAARNRAETLITRAEQAQLEARRARAETYASSEYEQAQRLLLEAKTRSASAERALEWKQAGDIADRAGRTFGLAVTRAQMQLSSRQSMPATAADDLVADTKAQVRRALEHYFHGQFRESAREFEALTQKSQSENAMIWAFLGASQYYMYYLEGESNREARRAAEQAFRKARTLRANLQLEPRYFSPRVREFYEALR